jgi:hypothetical protein
MAASELITIGLVINTFSAASEQTAATAKRRRRSSQMAY